MYIVLMYDIISDDEGARISRNVYKICKRYLTNIQKSAFEGNLSELEYMMLKAELAEFIRKDKDDLLIFSSRSEKWLKKEFIGKKNNKTLNMF